MRVKRTEEPRVVSIKLDKNTNRYYNVETKKYIVFEGKDLHVVDTEEFYNGTS